MHGVLINARQVSNGAIAKGWVVFNSGLDGFDISIVGLGCGFGGAVIERSAWHLEPSAQFLDADSDSLHGFPVGILKVFDMLLSQFFDFKGLGLKGVLHAPLGFIDPVFNLRG